MPALIIGFLFAVIGTCFLPVAVSTLYNTYRLAARDATRPAIAHVVNLYKSGGRGPSYNVDYDYDVGSMTVHARMVDISHDNWERLREGSGLLCIKYLTADPAVSEPLLTGQRTHALIHGWLFVLSTALVMAMGYWAGVFSQDRQWIKIPRKTPLAGEDLKQRSPAARRGARAGPRS